MARKIGKKNQKIKNQPIKKEKIKKNVCSYCGWRTAWLSSLKCHIKAKHLFETYTCGRCDMKFTLWSNGIRHSKKMHAGLSPLIEKQFVHVTGAQNVPSNDAANSDQTVDNEIVNSCLVDVVEHEHNNEIAPTDIFTCQICGFVGEEDNQILSHIMSSHITSDIIEEIGDENVEISFIDNWMDSLDEATQLQLSDNELNCRQCDYVTSAVNEYLQHIRLHHIPNMICACGVVCDGHEGLIAHMQSEHIEKHSCPICKLEILGYCKLEAHVKENHLH